LIVQRHTNLNGAVKVSCLEFMTWCTVFTHRWVWSLQKSCTNLATHNSKQYTNNTEQ